MSSPFLEVKKFLVGKIEEQKISPCASAQKSIILSGSISSKLSSGTGLKVDTTAVAGAITAAVINTGDGGTGYAVGDVVLVEGGINGMLTVATVAAGVVATLTVKNGGSGYTTGTEIVTAAMPSWATKLPQEFVIYDADYRERVQIVSIAVATGVYTITTLANLAHSYAAPFCSILTPGAVQSLTSNDFNVRLRALTMAPTIAPDGEAEKFATGDHRKDFSIMGVRSGTVGFSDKVAVNHFAGAGLTINTTAVAGAITVAAINAGGTGYNVGDLVELAGGTDGILQIKTVNTNTGAVTAIQSIVDAGSTYTTATGVATTVIPQLPTWGKFAVGLGCLPKKYTTTGYGLIIGMNDADDITMTLAMCYVQGGGNPSGQQYLFAGCKGDGDLSADGLGKPWTLKGSFTGKFVGVSDISNANILQLTLPETALPEKMLSNLVNVTPVGSTSAVPLRVTKFSITFGNKVSMVPNQEDATGIDYYMITERDLKITIDPLLKPVSEEDIFSNVKDEQAVGILIKSAITSPNMFVEMPRSQLMYPSIGNKDGMVDTSRTYRGLGNDLGGGSAQAAMLAASTAEIVIGTRA